MIRHFYFRLYWCNPSSWPNMLGGLEYILGHHSIAPLPWHPFTQNRRWLLIWGLRWLTVRSVEMYKGHLISGKLFVPNSFDQAVTIFGNLFWIFRRFQFSLSGWEECSILEGTLAPSLSLSLSLLSHRYIFCPHPSTSLVIESETLWPGLFISINIILIISAAHIKYQEAAKTKGRNFQLFHILLQYLQYIFFAVLGMSENLKMYSNVNC